MDVRNNTSGNILPRQPNGDRKGSVRQTNQQLTQAFSGSESSKPKSPFKGGSFLLQLILNLIIKLLGQLGHKKPPVKDDFLIRPVYGTPVAEPPEGDIRAVYGTPVVHLSQNDDGLSSNSKEQT